MKRMIGVLALTTMAMFVGCGDDDDGDGGDTGGSAGKGGSSAGKGGSGGSGGSSAGKGGAGAEGGGAGETGEGGTPSGEGGAGGDVGGPVYDYEAACTPQCEENAACLDSGAGGGGAGGAPGESFDVEECIAGCAAQAEAGCEEEYQDLLDCRGAEETTYECVEDAPGVAVPIGCDDEAEAYGTCLSN